MPGRRADSEGATGSHGCVEPCGQDHSAGSSTSRLHAEWTSARPGRGGRQLFLVRKLKLYERSRGEADGALLLKHRWISPMAMTGAVRLQRSAQRPRPTRTG